MVKTSRRRGSAMILAIVIVILTAGIGGAFLALSNRSHKDQFLKNQTDDATQICDAAMELARAAMLMWRNADHDTRPPELARDPQCYAWNKIFKYCADQDGANPGMGASANADVIRLDAMKRFKDPSGSSWGADKNYNYDSSNTPMLIGDVGPNTMPPTTGPGVAELFCKNRRYGKGAFHLALKNNSGDKHGDGIDNGMPRATGNPWAWDGPQVITDPVTKKPVTLYPGDTLGGLYNAGSVDPLIDGDGQAILVVTATLPDGTVCQMEVLLAYPFNQGPGQNAIEDNGDIDMQGAFNILGTMGNVFANGNITGNGGNQASVQGYVNAAGDASGLKMNVKPGGGINSGVSPIPINPVNIPDFLTDPKYSDLQKNMYKLAKDGKIYNVSTGANVTGTIGFTLKSGTWNVDNKNGTIPNAVYYVEGDMKLAGQGNDPPFQLTIIATGSVELGGNTKFSAATVDGTPTGQSLGSLVVAGADIKLSGNGVTGDVQYDGSMFANEQISIQGTFDLNGSITGANATDTPGSAVSSTSKLSDPDLTVGGTPTIIYNGGSTLIKPTADHLELKAIHRTRITAGGIVKNE